MSEHQGVSEGSRNTAATVVAAKEIDAAIERVRKWNLTNHPPLPDDELTKVISSALKRRIE